MARNLRFPQCNHNLAVLRKMKDFRQLKRKTKSCFQTSVLNLYSIVHQKDST